MHIVARAAVFATLALLTPIAEAETRPACADRSSVIDRLENRYGETLQSLGLNQQNGILEVYASEETGTWTILVTRPDGISCLVGAGEMWEANASPLAPRGTAL